MSSSEAEQAWREYRDGPEFSPRGRTNHGATKRPFMAGYRAGVEASQPREVTDEMVEAAAWVIYRSQTAADLLDTSVYRPLWIKLARAALEAAEAARREPEPSTEEGGS